MKKKRNILFYTSETIPHNAGDGRNAFNFAKSLQKLEITTTLLTLDKGNRLSGSEKVDGIEIKRIPYFNKNILQKFISRIIALSYFFRKVLRHESVFIYGRVMSHKILILYSKILGRKVIFQSNLFKYDDIDTLLDTNIITKKYRKFIYGLIDGYFAINPSFSESFRKNYNRNEIIFESVQGVDTGLFLAVDNNTKQKQRKSLNLPLNKTIIISVGHLINRKGFHGIFNKLSSLKNDFHYIIAGNYKDDENYYLKNIQNEMRELYELGQNKLSEKVSFIGFKENVVEYLQCADIFLLNSNQEGTPNVLLEAMSCGMPPVLRKLTGLTNFIIQDEKNALVFNDEDEMIDKIDNLISNPELKLEIGLNAQKTIVDNYDIDNVAKKFIAFFDLGN